MKYIAETMDLDDNQPPNGALRFVKDNKGKKVLQMYSFIWAKNPMKESGYQWVDVPLIDQLDEVIDEAIKASEEVK